MLERRNGQTPSDIQIIFDSMRQRLIRADMLLQLLIDKVKKNKDSGYETYLKKIEVQTDKLTHFINDLLDVSKMQTKKFQYNFSTINVKVIWMKRLNRCVLYW